MILKNSEKIKKILRALSEENKQFSLAVRSKYPRILSEQFSDTLYILFFLNF